MYVSDTDSKTMSAQSNSKKPDENGISKSNSHTDQKRHESRKSSSDKDKKCEHESDYYLKKRIIAAISKSFQSNGNKTIQHTFNLNDSETDNNPRQSVTVIVKRVDLDKNSLHASQESNISETINLGTFTIFNTVPTVKNETKSHSSHRSSDKKSEKDSIKGPCLVCNSCGRREEKKWIHVDCQNKCCRSTSFYCDRCLKYKIKSNDFKNDILRNLTYSKYMYVVVCPIGRGMSLHMDYDKMMHLRSDDQRKVATEFLTQAFKEDDKGFAQFTIAIVHNGARYMPEMLKLLARLHPNLTVKTNRLKSSIEMEQTDLATYYKKVKETYNNGTYAYGPLVETQAACTKNDDETGAYLPELLSLLEKSPFLSQVLPWGDLTTKRYSTPFESDDGPIFWCRPGEQIVPLDRNSSRSRWNSGEIEAFLKNRKNNMNHLNEKQLIVEELKKYRRSYSTREFLFEDRTRPHADQVWGNHFEPTAAVGVIQAIHPDERPNHNRICKDIVVFQAKHYEMLEALLHIDYTAAPKQQCAEWLDDAKLNMVKQMKIEYSRILLRDNDIYFIPRKIVHQFKTVSATLSVAWHARLSHYYAEKSTTEHVCETEPDKEEKYAKNKSKKRSNSRDKTCDRRRERSRKRKHKHKSRSAKKLKEDCDSLLPVSKKEEEISKSPVEENPVIVKTEPNSSNEVNVEPNHGTTANEENDSVKCSLPCIEIVDIGSDLKTDENKIENSSEKDDTKLADAEVDDQVKITDDGSDVLKTDIKNEPYS